MSNADSDMYPHFDPTRVHLKLHYRAHIVLVETASTPQGFVCNSVGERGPEVAVNASTPQGFVCNEPIAHPAFEDLFASTPQGFVCNPLDTRRG